MPVAEHYVDADIIESVSVDETASEMKELEDWAHARRALLSSDAMRHLISKSRLKTDRITYLDEVLAVARTKYPSDDGWLVMNLARMEEVCAELAASQGEGRVEDILPILSPATGSLAEAILTGNVKAALGLIDLRPMVSLAEATSDLDAAYRFKKTGMGSGSEVSELLKNEVAKLPVEKLETIIKALTSAIDGTYTDEKAAVKTAILKATSVINSN